MQTHHDAFSRVFLTYPIRQRTTEKIQDTIPHFFPAEPGEAVVCKCDNAKEALAALRSLENMFPHNSVHERDTRTWAEILRTNYFASGLHIFLKA